MFLQKSLILILAISMSLLEAPAHAKSISLFDDQKNPLSNYDKKIIEISPNDEIVFLNGKKFTILETLGGAVLSKVFKAIDSEGRTVALRLSNNQHHTHTVDVMYQTYLEFFFKKADFPIAKIIDFEAGEYLTHEYQELIYSYDEFISTFRKTAYNRSFKPWIDLKMFAKKTAHFRMIGDLRPDQVFYTKNGWVILDWLNGSILAEKIQDPTVFKIDIRDGIEIINNGEFAQGHIREESLYLPSRALRAEIETVIHDERKSQGLPEADKTLFEKCAQVLLSTFQKK